MRVLGVIMEVNPFHNGHKWFLETAKTLVNPDVIIAITSTSFTMRGDPSLLDKIKKTKILLDNHVDLVVELPIVKTLNSADYFSKYSLEILYRLGITDLAFGIEDGRDDILQEIYHISSSLEFEELFKTEIAKKKSYKQAFKEAFIKINPTSEAIDYLDKPNFTLALQYLKTINSFKKRIILHPIKRLDNYYYGEKSNIASAYTIREKFNDNEEISHLIPYPLHNLHKVNEECLYSLIKYKFFIEDNNLTDYHLIDEGIENYIKNNFTATSYQELLSNLANKRYTKSRFKRLFMSVLIGIKKVDLEEESYCRILGFNNCGSQYLNTLPVDVKASIVTTFKNTNNRLSELELKATNLYLLLTNMKFSNQEYLIPIKKEEKHD